MSARYTLQELADLVGGSLLGEAAGTITGVAGLDEAGAGEATWLSNPKYASQLNHCRAGVVLVPKDHQDAPVPVIVCDQVDRAVRALLAAFGPPHRKVQPGVHATAVVKGSVDGTASIGPHVVVEAGAKVGANTTLHAGVYIGADVTVGKDCVLWPHVVVRERCRLGDRVEIHANAVIGADGFGFDFDGGKHAKIPHTGGVRIEDDVEIGACSCVDRAKFGETVVGAGTKIDNLVQIAHNVRVGRHCVMAAQVGISGSVRIGDYCVFAGRAAAADNVEIGEGARLAAVAVADKDIPAGATVSGNPAQPHRRELRDRASVRRMEGTVRQLKDLQSRVDRLEASADDKP